MSSGEIARLCRSVLPPDFEMIKHRLPAIQQFLEENLPEPMNQAVTLLTITDEVIVIAANSPLVTNYLRLHSNEIQQQLRETFNLEQTLKFRSVPDAMLKLHLPANLPQPRQVSTQSVEAIRRSAQWIEDEQLQAALLSLAESLGTD